MLELRDELRLAAEPRAASLGRAFSGSLLRAWKLDHLSDDADLIVTELISNAVRASGVTVVSPHRGELNRSHVLRVRLTLRPTAVIIEVFDLSSEMPRLRDTSVFHGDEGGRGLVVISELSARWGCYPDDRGKWVWAELPLYPSAS